VGIEKVRYGYHGSAYAATERKQSMTPFEIIVLVCLGWMVLAGGVFIFRLIWYVFTLPRRRHDEGYDEGVSWGREQYGGNRTKTISEEQLDQLCRAVSERFRNTSGNMSGPISIPLSPRDIIRDKWIQLCELDVNSDERQRLLDLWSGKTPSGNCTPMPTGNITHFYGQQDKPCLACQHPNPIQAIYCRRCGITVKPDMATRKENTR
jgi:hypothetical protein